MIRLFAIATAMLLTATAACAADLQPIKDAGPYVPSPQSVVSDMLRYADVGANDFLIDLGSGDGRIVLTAAKVFGARGFGVEIKEDLVKLANEAAQKEGLADRVKFLKADLFKTDISQATVITMYLLPDTVNLLKDKFLTELRPGTRIVSGSRYMVMTVAWEISVLNRSAFMNFTRSARPSFCAASFALRTRSSLISTP